MIDDRWNDVIAIFEQAIELPAEEREAFVERATAGDAELRARVLAMLHSDAAGHPLLDLTPDQLAVELAAVPSREGQRIGPYVLEREIGHGGMGAVYLARREDVDKRVALKLVTGGHASHDRIQRFLFERRVLAQLEHPDIARLLDAGITEDGTPWLAMEYVEGTRIDHWCDERALSIEQRLALFERVCHAVDYAHRNLVVHRDVKPSNILVTEQGEPKLVDFGIAKLLEPSDDTPVTRTGAHPMTPEYAAPEQIRGEPITTATDVYQLGVLLYLLLTGRHPHAFHRRAVHELHRAITEHEAERPSRTLSRLAGTSRTTPEDAGDAARIAGARGLTPERLRRRLQGDLDAIALMAIRSEPPRRYASAQQLAEDIRRHLENRPVLATPDTFAYRARKFVERNRVSVAAAAIVFFSLVAATAGMTWQAGRATRAARIAAEERDRSAREAEKSRQVAAFLEDLFEGSDPFEAGRRDVTARELLDRGAERLSEQGELAGQPEVRAALLDVLGRVYRSLQDNDRARTLLEQGLALRQQHLAPGHPDIAQSLVSLGVLAVYEQRVDDARTLFEQALAIRRSQPVPDSSGIAELLHNLSAVHNHNAALDTAEMLLREAIDIRSRLPGEEQKELLAQNYIGLGVILAGSGRAEAADSMYQQALRIRREILPPDHPGIAGALNVIGALRLRQGRPAEAEPVLRESLGILRTTLGEHTDVAAVLNNLGSSLERQGKYAEAEAAYRESLDMKRRIIDGDHASTAVSLNNLGLILMRQEKWVEAERLLEESLDMRTRLWTGPHPAIAGAHSNMGELYARREQFARAARHFQLALDMYRDRAGPPDAAAFRVAMDLARVLELQGENVRAAAVASWMLEAGPTANLPPSDTTLVAARRLLSRMRR